MLTKNLTIRKLIKKHSSNYESSSGDHILEKLLKNVGGGGVKDRSKSPVQF